MPITYYSGESMFNLSIPCLVNTVNCEGYMGKGLALEFKQQFAHTGLDAAYKHSCAIGKFKPGMTLPYRLTDKELGDELSLLILNVATKGEWRKSSKLEWIETILQRFTENYERLKITHVAFPKMGCGLGGLKWEQVGPLYRKYLGDLPIQVDVFIGEDDIQF